MRLLITWPVSAYVISYLYLAYYHEKFFIFDTIVHESGKYTLLQTTLYASHFLGHVPVHTVLAFWFVGAHLSLTGPNLDTYLRKKIRTILILLVLLFLSSFLLSLSVFGHEDTLAFIAQQKQGVRVYAKGGSWNLHLPSTMLVFLLIPVYIYVVKAVFGKTIELSSNGLFLISSGFICFFFFTFLFNRNIVGAFFAVWGDPRYLAHSVRELLTFPVTYFPLPLYLILRGEKQKRGGGYRRGKQNTNLKYAIACLAILFLLGLFYQSYISLTEGIGNLAQKPDFAKCGKLGIPYLLASHYFEHFLDTIYFSLLCLLLYGFAMNKASELNRTK